jgi:hypothetical protein
LAEVTIVGGLGLLWLGCGWGSGMRSEAENRFAPAPSGVPFRECEFGYRPPPQITEVEVGRRIFSADWVPYVGGAALISDWDRRFSHAHQELVFVTTSGTPQPLPLPSSLRSWASAVHLVARPEPLVVVEEWSWTDAERTRWVIEDVFGVSDHGDLVVMDLSGVQVARHRSAHWALLSPDFRWMAYWRSGDDGLHNLFVTRPEQASAAFVLALVESDPGSGMSFSECWSEDSRYLHISGTASGWQPFRWTYDAAARELYANSEGQEPTL